jgi:hypothetical protein
MTKHLGRRIVSIVWVESNTTVTAFIEVIQGLTTYRVRYDKAWRAKEHVLTLLWGILEKSLCKSTDVATCHITLQSRHKMCHRYLWSVVAQ